MSLTIKICVNFVSIIVQENSEQMATTGIDVSKLFLNSVMNTSLNLHQRKIEDICFYTEVINGNIFYKEEDKDMINNMSILKEKWDPLKDINLIAYLRSLLFCVKFVLHLIDDSRAGDDGENEEATLLECTVPSFDVVEMDDLIPISLNLCYGLILSKTLKRCYNDVCTYFYLFIFSVCSLYSLIIAFFVFFKSKQYFICGNDVETLGSLLKELIHRLDAEQQSKVLSLSRQK